MSLDQDLNAINERICELGEVGDYLLNEIEATEMVENHEKKAFLEREFRRIEAEIKKLANMKNEHKSR